MHDGKMVISSFSLNKAEKYNTIQDTTELAGQLFTIGTQ